VRALVGRHAAADSTVRYATAEHARDDKVTGARRLRLLIAQ
jgi:hypothetical protein